MSPVAHAAAHNRTVGPTLARAGWADVPAVIIASGPSLTKEQLDHVWWARWSPMASRCHVIAVNNTCARASWADIVYFGDYLALRAYLPGLKPQAPGEWWTGSQAGAKRWQLRAVKTSGRPGLGKDRVHLNGNSGFQALNLAVLFGARKVLLLGFDMKPSADGRQHWFGEHPAPLVQTCLFAEWRHKAPAIADDAKAMGVDIVNVTPGSALEAFRRGDLEAELS